MKSEVRVCHPRPAQCPTPHGVGGLKYPVGILGVITWTSHPTRGGWIEIWAVAQGLIAESVPPHTGWVD